MKKLISLVVVLALVGLLIANINSPALAAYRHYFYDGSHKLVYFSPCDNPIHYKVGTVDSKFGVSEGEFEKDVSESGQIWDKVDGRNLFVEDPKGTLTINLVFDERQNLRNQTTQLENQLKQEQNNLNPQIQAYQSEQASFKQKLADLNSQIQMWNSKGGAPEDVYKQLLQQQSDLRAEADKLNQEARSLNLSTQDYNSGVGQLNQTVNSFNALLSVKPEEGLFDPAQNKIDIYFDNSQPELLHTLAHELGHSLGMDHNSNPKSIMYAYSTESTTPTKEDIASLSAICREKSLTELAQDFLKDYIGRVQTVLGNLQR